MKPIACFYHCCFSSRHRQIDIRFAMWLVSQQMHAFTVSELAAAANEIHVCVNGDESDVDVARLIVPEKCQVHANGAGANSEIPTMNRIRDWAQVNRGWNVLYFHAKGLSHQENPNTSWRLTMERHCLWNWRMCVFDLDRGFEAVGCYWLTPEQHGPLIQKTPFFGGTFWWARSEYLAQLPPLPEDTFENRYIAEAWIGSRPQRPRVQSYASGWPPVH